MYKNGYILENSTIKNNLKHNFVFFSNFIYINKCCFNIAWNMLNYRLIIV